MPPPPTLANLKLEVFATGDEPRVRDVDLGRALGFDRPRDVRKLVARHRGALTGFGDIQEVQGSYRGQPTTEFHLNEKQAVFLVSKSDTPAATDLLVQVVEVFHAWRHGHLPAAPTSAGLQAVDRSAIGGIVKGILHRELAEALPTAIREAIDGLTIDPSVSGVVHFKPAFTVCEGAPPRKRRGLVQRVSARLLRYSVQNGHPLREEPYTGRRMFHVDAIGGWLGAEGRLLLSQHIADAQGAPVLPFKPRGA